MKCEIVKILGAQLNLIKNTTDVLKVMQEKLKEDLQDSTFTALTSIALIDLLGGHIELTRNMLDSAILVHSKLEENS